MPNELDPRKKRTRALLQQAFMELLSEKEFLKINVQDITERAMVNRATFYAHFEDKFALLDDTMREMFQRMLRTRLPEDAEFSPENLEQLTLAVFEFMGQMNGHCHPSRLHQQIGHPLELKVQAELYDFLLNWFQAHPSPEITATVVSWGIFGASLRWSMDNRHSSAEMTARQTLALIRDGLALQAID
jgi:AcrR family transcriptional regulator